MYKCPTRVLIDVWVAQTQLLGGALYLAAFGEARKGRSWRGLAVSAALTIIGFAAAMLPVLVQRAPVAFRIPLGIYLACSVFVVVAVTRSRIRERRSQVQRSVAS